MKRKLEREVRLTGNLLVITNLFSYFILRLATLVLCATLAGGLHH